MASTITTKTATPAILQKVPRNVSVSSAAMIPSAPPSTCPAWGTEEHTAPVLLRGEAGVRMCTNRNTHPTSNARYSASGRAHTECQSSTFSSIQREIDQIKMTRLTMKVKAKIVCQKVFDDAEIFTLFSALPHPFSPSRPVMSLRQAGCPVPSRDAAKLLPLHILKACARQL